ncbi:hypothetical protein TIFTF001_048906 [Ficus carica]|uniref:Uncharacterized protein n=1 Tax=Ficus carica TaxID=3494 RepID=A0AA87YXX2_FICCA|nr:hypothetical protein TIFTF001_047235 [Ficus carica]GMN21602.1 hypothetical protein TIFTF001_048903 [Ficus carica]GMN21604.1 hypothetical protein TIFTF001_048904 [Ficus carica]GMN21611.1 hypothetical protein TIFTF001_048905 [Ficus carica]GMN21619.1 hypothetical protein TIFTF001_048906 [Ficus carica]
MQCCGRCGVTDWEVNWGSGLVGRRLDWLCVGSLVAQIGTELGKAAGRRLRERGWSAAMVESAPPAAGLESRCGVVGLGLCSVGSEEETRLCCSNPTAFQYRLLPSFCPNLLQLCYSNLAAFLCRLLPSFCPPLLQLYCSNLIHHEEML